MVAVLAVPNPDQPQTLPGSIQSGIPQSQSTNSMASLVTATIEDESSLGKPPYMPSRKSSLGEEEEWIVQDQSTSAVHQSLTVSPILDKKVYPFGQANIDHPQSSSTVDSSHPSTPVRRIYLYNKPVNQARKQKRAVVVHSDAVRTL